MLYPTITYYLSNGETQITIPDLSVVIITNEEELENMDQGVLDIATNKPEMPEPSSFLDLEYNPEKTIGVKMEEVTSIHFDLMEIVPSNDLESIMEFENSLSESDLYSKEVSNTEDIGKKAVINVEVPSVLLDMLNKKQVDLSELIDNAIIEELFY